MKVRLRKSPGMTVGTTPSVIFRRTFRSDKTMQIAANDPYREKRVDLILTAGGGRVSGQDLLRITEIAEKERALCHISDGPRQILIGIPKEAQRPVRQSLRAIGWNCEILPEGANLIEILASGGGEQ